MTQKQFEKVPFHFVSHIALKMEHIHTYVSDDGRFAISVITPVLKNGDFGTPRKYYRIGNERYKSKKKFLEALEKI